MRDVDDLSTEERMRLLRATAQGPAALEMELVALDLSDFDEAAADSAELGPQLCQAVIDAIDIRKRERGL